MENIVSYKLQNDVQWGIITKSNLHFRIISGTFLKLKSNELKSTDIIPVYGIESNLDLKNGSTESYLYVSEIMAFYKFESDFIRSHLNKN